MLVRREVVQMRGLLLTTQVTLHTAEQPVSARVLGGGKYKPALLNPLISTWLLVSANGVSGNQRAPGTRFQIRGIVPGAKEEQLEEQTPKKHK